MRQTVGEPYDKDMDSVERTYKSDGVTLVYTETPPAPWTTGDRFFLLVHGIGMGRIVFKDMAPPLATQGRVVAPDLAGFGDSPEPGSATDIEQSAANLAAFIESFGVRKAVLVGHSMGTQIVTQLAADRPDLIEGLVLIAPTVNRHERTALRQAARMIQDLTGEGPKVLLIGIYEYFKTNPVWFVNKLRFMLNQRIEDICPRVRIPVLVIRGETDRVCPRGWTQEVTAAFPSARMEEIRGRGHEAIIKSPQPVASMILDYVTD